MILIFRGGGYPVGVGAPGSLVNAVLLVPALSLLSRGPSDYLINQAIECARNNPVVKRAHTLPGKHFIEGGSPVFLSNVVRC